MIHFDMTFAQHIDKLSNMIRTSTANHDQEALFVYADMIDHRIDSLQILVEVTDCEAPPTTNTQTEMWRGMMEFVSASAQLARQDLNQMDLFRLNRHRNAAYVHAMKMAENLDIEAAEVAERVKSRLFEQLEQDGILDTDPNT